MSSLRVGEVLVKQGLLRPDQLAKVLEEQKRTGLKLTQVLVSTGTIKDAQLLSVLAAAYQLPSIDLGTFDIQKDVMDLVKKDFCLKHGCIPVQKVGATTLVVAFSDPSNMQVRDDLRFMTRCKIQPVVATDGAILAALEKAHGQAVNQMTITEEDADVQTVETEDINKEGGQEEWGPIVKFVNAVLADAVVKKTSDIHFEPYEKRFRVRFRVDGNMVEVASQPPSSGVSICSRIKIMSKLDISEKRRPQDGRLKIRIGSKEMDFRVSVLPTIWGEKIVMRLLDKANLQLDMTKLGMEPEDLAMFKESIYQPQGLLLITGPTGSGKTTTIYSALYELNKPDLNIATAEDPVEFNFEGINQVQMNADIGLNFSSALRSFLRQDPDVIMVGEIRDLETAEIAMKAASTGHMVVSTLHTNDAPQTVTRLTEMGIAPYIVTSTLNLIVAQRLVGTVCPNCKAPHPVDAATLIGLGVDPSEVGEYKTTKGRGCSTCNGTGIKGRSAIFELMKMTGTVKDAVLNGASSREILVMAKKEGMRTLRRSALLKLKRGITTVEEVMNASVKDVE